MQRSVGWRVRKLKAKGAPEVVYGREGIPLILPIDADMDDLRREVRTEGRYRLDPIDEHNRPIAGCPAGYCASTKESPRPHRDDLALPDVDQRVATSAPPPWRLGLRRQRSSRDDFTIAVLRHIAQEVAYRCANPDCWAPTSLPSTQRGGSNIGVGAHITAAAAGGPRFDPSLTPDQRRSATNAIWLCNTCARLIDNDEITYTISKLAQWKHDAIERAQKALASGGRSTHEGLIAAQLNPETAWREVRRVVMSCRHDVFYKIVEHAGKPRDIREKLAQALKNGASPYRFVGESLPPITSDAQPNNEL